MNRGVVTGVAGVAAATPIFQKNLKFLVKALKNFIIWGGRPPQSFGHLDMATPKILPLLRP